MPRDMQVEQLAQHTDAALLDRYAAGDPVAARALTLRLVPRALGYAARLLGDAAEAEDVAQEAMLRLWRAAPGWRSGEAQVTTWLYRVVTNLCTDRLRSRKRRPVTALEAAPEMADGGPGAVAGMIEADRMAALQAALDALPDRQRQAVVLRHIEGLTNPEIAAVMDIGVEAVESLTARGKRALSAILAGRREELGYEDEIEPMRAQDDLDDLFATARNMPVRPSAALLDRVLADGLDVQPRRSCTPMRPPAVASAGPWSRLAALFGGAGALAGMGTAAAAGLLIGFAQPGNLAILGPRWGCDAGRPAGDGGTCPQC